MKIRNGFVSNSSSSSFVLKIPYFPKSIQDMKKILGIDEDSVILHSWDNESFPTNQVVEIIYNDVVKSINNLPEKEKIDIQGLKIHKYNMDIFDNIILFKYEDKYKSLKREYKITNNEFDNYRNSEKNKPYNQEYYWERLNEISDEMIQIIKKSIIENNKKTDIVISLEYSDNDGSVHSFIEHGDVLSPITLSSISNH